MLYNLRIIIYLLAVSKVFSQNHWEIAVAVKDQIELLWHNGSLLCATVKKFTDLKALTFDNLREEFVVSDRDMQNDSIIRVHVAKETEVTETKTIPIIGGLADDIQGLALDPFEDILYWTNFNDRTIKYLRLNRSEEEQPNKLFEFNPDVHPRGIAIDICSRYIYWTNRNMFHPTIERALLSGLNRTTLIESDLKQPTGIVVDYRLSRLYWADLREGIYFRIESSNLDGKEREIVCEDTHTKPFGIAVDESFIYWTDNSNHAIWRLSKTHKGVPARIKEFEDTPWGIIGKPVQIRDYSDCEHLKNSIKNSVEKFKEMETVAIEHDSTFVECLNGGTLAGNICICKPGYAGQYCQVEDCRNYCVHGTCHLSRKGFAQCHCPSGFSGDRCEVDSCLSYCLNGGSCIFISGQPRCTCNPNYTGDRCETGLGFKFQCRLFCQDHSHAIDQNYLLSKDEECRCLEEGSFTITENNLTIPSLYSEASPFYGRSFLEKVSLDSSYMALVIMVAVLVTINVIFVVYHFTSKRKRPRVTKRMVVTRSVTPKNVTPLTYRPQPTTEQCEVTIENCCNMNVCETPCFEPPSFLTKNGEDKKVLLSEMESGEESY
ncbi:protein cueball [Euwallacea similis]|uniref:protein cueball n=1 Tax=Euwallacea similis TaxID=1736056 RepID=UPI00344E6D43